MAVKMRVKGLDDLITALHTLDADTDKIISTSMYDGAGLLIEQVKREIQTLPEDPGYKQPGVLRNAVTPGEKQDLLNHVGIARYTKSGGKTSTAIGFDGYGSYKTRKYPNGVPVALVARSLEAGSSVRQKHPFMRSAVKATQEQITRMMEDRMRDELQKQIGGA